MGCDFTNDGASIVSGGYNKRPQLIDVKTGELQQTLSSSSNRSIVSIPSVRKADCVPRVTSTEILCCVIFSSDPRNASWNGQVLRRKRYVSVPAESILRVAGHWKGQIKTPGSKVLEIQIDKKLTMLYPRFMGRRFSVDFSPDESLVALATLS